jgi:signal transduction histidine kinase
MPENVPGDAPASAAPTNHSFRTTLDHLLEGFQIIAPDWTYLYVNPAAARHGRRRPEELHGRKMWDAYPGIQDTPLFAVLSRCMRERTATSFENQFTFPDQTTRWFELRVVPVPEGLCVHSFDIQARKDADTALRLLNQELEARIATRTGQLRLLNEELEAFSYSVSHDLRAPLREIGRDIESLRRLIGTGAGEVAQSVLNHATDAVARAERLIDDLLSFSRVGREPLRKRHVDLADIVRRAQDEAAGAAGGVRQVVWSVGQLPVVHADPALLHLAMVNLLSNALKFTEGRSPARIEISARSDEMAGEVVIAVRDNGVGFDASHAQRLFGVFQRLHPEGEFPGSGIGLANVRRIVARHGGRTWAEGTSNAGATFYITLPASPTPA